MTIEKLSSGSYRIREMYNGKRYSITVKHKPTKKEATMMLAEKYSLGNQKEESKSSTFEASLNDYISAKDKILSPRTIKGYKQLSNMFSPSFKRMNIYDINQEDIQIEVNRYAANHSPKSVKNFSGLISAVFKLKRPSMKLNTTLPEMYQEEAVIPLREDLMKVLEYFEGTEYHIPIQLAMLGMRRSEILALTVDDLDGNTLNINKALVENSDNEYVIKKTKKGASQRKIYIPTELAEEIMEKGYIYKGHPGNILRQLHVAQDKLGLERCKLHELRHFYVSYAHEKGMSDANIIANVGHKTDSITKRVYLHAYEREKAQAEIANMIFDK